MMKAPFLTASLLVLCLPAAIAQQSDSTYLAAARKNAIQVYTQAVGSKSHLYNGVEYKEYVSYGQEFPFMFDDVMYGNVKYGGELYENIPLYYDLEKDLVITTYTQGSKVQLINDRVEYFDIGAHRFVRIDNGKVPTGFYDLLYDGKMKFYARRIKVYSLRASGADAVHEFEERVKYYILKDGVYHTVKNKRSVINLMKVHSKDLKRTIKEEKLNFRKDRENSIARLLERNEQIQ